MSRIIFYIVIAVSIILLISLWHFYNATHPFRIYSAETPANFNLAYENVSFKTKDGVKLKGWYIPAKNPTHKTIILLHGYGADKGNILSSRIFLHPDFNLLFMDFRYFGQSDGRYSTAGALEVNDLKAAINYLQGKGIDEVGVWGLSMGAAVAIMTAAQSKAIKAIVSESSYASLEKMMDVYFIIPGFRYIFSKLMRIWGMLFLDVDILSVSPEESIKSLKVPILIIHSKIDWQIPYSNAQTLQKKLEKKSNAEFLIYENAPHGWLDKNTQRKIKLFFEKNLSS